MRNGTKSLNSLAKSQSMRRIENVQSLVQSNGLPSKVCELTCCVGLVVTAQTEAQVAQYVPTERPATAGEGASTPAPSSLAKLIAPLLAAIDEESVYPEDAVQASVCLGWIHWTLHETALAAVRMPQDVMTVIQEVAGDGPPQAPSWIHVCAMKCAYIKGTFTSKVVYHTAC